MHEPQSRPVHGGVKLTILSVLACLFMTWWGFTSKTRGIRCEFMWCKDTALGHHGSRSTAPLLFYVENFALLKQIRDGVTTAALPLSKNG
jgi:hypothetical protein